MTSLASSYELVLVSSGLVCRLQGDNLESLAVWTSSGMTMSVEDELRKYKVKASGSVYKLNL